MLAPCRHRIWDLSVLQQVSLMHMVTAGSVRDQQAATSNGDSVVFLLSDDLIALILVNYEQITITSLTQLQSSRLRRLST